MQYRVSVPISCDIDAHLLLGFYPSVLIIQYLLLYSNIRSYSKHKRYLIYYEIEISYIFYKKILKTPLLLLFLHGSIYVVGFSWPF